MLLVILVKIKRGCENIKHKGRLLGWSLLIRQEHSILKPVLVSLTKFFKNIHQLRTTVENSSNSHKALHLHSKNQTALFVFLLGEYINLYPLTVVQANCQQIVLLLFSGPNASPRTTALDTRIILKKKLRESLNSPLTNAKLISLSTFQLILQTLTDCVFVSREHQL